MNIEVLISTMNLESNKELVKRMNVKALSVTINQITETNKSLISTTESDSMHRVYSYYEKGLSKSRNNALQHSNSDICIIADDDVTYYDNCFNTILDAYKRYPDADIIAFYVKSKNSKRPTTKQSTKRINFLTSMKISSFQITFKRNSILEKEIKFDENFGAGTDKYFMGEDNIFLTDCLKNKLKIIFVNETIAEVNQSQSTWFNGYNSKYFIAKGACFYRMNKIFYHFLIIQFAIRKHSLYKEHLKLLDAINNMFKGTRNIRKELYSKTVIKGNQNNET